MLRPTYLFASLYLIGCTDLSPSTKESAQIVTYDTVIVTDDTADTPPLRMLEDIPVEDRKYIRDTAVRAPQASRKNTERYSQAISAHEMVPPEPEAGTFFIITGSFTQETEAEKHAQLWREKGYKIRILPYQKRQRVAIEIHATEDKVRTLLDSLNKKDPENPQFWLIHGW